ncbi:MAG TPA: hydantoinase/oxoprolinase family protein [Bryobacteraceae bacterium]|nr:hydantoinase/oxoprolinase family protein [Bryobacteraceae bacterium]
MRIGVDAGGTFTDFIAVHDDGRIETFKLRSNPHAPASVILEGLARIGRRADVVHGSTVGTNALLEHTGARTAFVTTAGFEDLLEIGRQNRAGLYNLAPKPRRLLADRALSFGVRERAYFDGTIALRPAAAELKRLAVKLRRARVRSVAICLLHSYRNAANERAVTLALRNHFSHGALYVCSSHEISPEFREYERSSTTFVNAYVGPLMRAYLEELARARGYRISILQSNGGFLSATQAARHAVRTVLSGPAGGVVGAIATARRSGFTHVLGFDMGGTSTDVNLADGAPRETTEASVDGLPIRIPMLDIHTVGAGGGSIARVDAGGLLRVGPESAGADPGPACYGKGTEATVTDAHVVLGRISEAQLLGGAMTIDAARSAAAVDRIAKSLKLDRESAAAGIVRVANANMERAIRAVSIERGRDPRDFALLAFGGCGGLHACEISAELGIRTVIVPQHAGALSALGMLMADEVRDYAAGVLGSEEIEQTLAALERRARRESPRASIEPSADVRYRGQSYELTVPWNARRVKGGVEAAFHREHERLYGYATPGRDVEIVTLRVRARRKTIKPELPREPKEAGRSETRSVWITGGWRKVPVWKRTQVSSRRQAGPALVLDYGSTTLIPPEWGYRRDAAGNLIITV